MVPCPDADTLNALVAGTLDTASRAHFFDHAADCAECHGVIEALLGAGEGSEPVKIDRYVIERRIGAGAMGVVYGARDPALARPVAIKVLRHGGSGPRLQREAQLLARLEHPNVVAVYDVGEHDGHMFVAMALVDGDNLRTWLATPREPDEIVRVLLDAGRGVVAAHAAGLVHRDLKPDNIFVGSDGAVRVGDFGLARLADDGGDDGSSTQGSMTLTRSGWVPGTPAYMAPEHTAGEPTPASDQFSFCVTAWEALCGSRPFPGATLEQLRDQIASGEVPAPPDTARMPARVRAALERGLRTDPDARFPSMMALLEALAPPRRRRWAWPVAVLSGVAAATVIVVIAASSRDSVEDPCAITERELDDVHLPATARDLLAGYERDWFALRRQTCLAARGPIDPRVQCLDRAHGALRTLVADLRSDAGPERVRRAALALPALGECQTAFTGVLSNDQQIAAFVLLGRIATMKMSVALSGMHSLDKVRALEDEARRINYPPAIVDAMLVEVDVLLASGQNEAAAELLRRALGVAESAHDDRRVAIAAARLTPLAIMLGKLDEARTMIELAAAADARIGGDLEVDILIAEARAEYASATGDHDAAIAILKAALERLRSIRGPDSIPAGELYGRLAREYTTANRTRDAAEALSHIPFGPVGSEEPLALARDMTAALAVADTRRARDRAQRLAVRSAELNHPGLAFSAVETIAIAYDLDGDGRRMIEAYRAVDALLDKTPAVDTPDQRGIALDGIGRGYLNIGDPARAIAPLRAAIEAYRKAGPAVKDELWSSEIMLARALVDTGVPHEARVLIEPVVHEIATAPDALPQRRAGASFQLARALWEDGGRDDRPRALALADDAERDYGVALDRQKDAPALMIAPLQRRLADLRAWRAHHK